MDRKEAERVREALQAAYIANEGQECVDAAILIGTHEVPEFEEKIEFFTNAVSGFGPQAMKALSIQLYLIGEQYGYNWVKDHRRV